MFNKYLLEIHWSWGKDWRHYEKTQLYIYEHEKERIDDIIKIHIDNVFRRLAFDCGNKGKPLYPCIDYISLRPVGEEQKIEFWGTELEEYWKQKCEEYYGMVGG